MPKTFVLKIGHRPERDKRISTHCALVARAFGADGIFLDQRDTELEARVESVVRRFGGPFSIETGVDWKKKLETWRDIGDIIHLTMYGIPIQDAMVEIAGSSRDKLIVVGGPKVPAMIYHAANHNVSVTQQPHSEVASICIFLDRYFRGAELNREFSRAEIRIVPQRVGKLVVRDD